MVVLDTLDPATESFADLHERLGLVPLHRIRLRPYPGTANEADVVFAKSRNKRLCELVEGVLLEKTMGQKEAMLALFIGRMIGEFADTHDLGIVLGADGMYRLKLGLIRIPDVSFIPWSRLPGEEVPNEEIGDVIPTLAVEVLSRSNTVGEIDRKIEEYFASGVKIVWIVNPRKETVRVYTSATTYKLSDGVCILEGGKLLPGFRLPLKRLFSVGRRRK